MNAAGFPILSLITWLPLVGGVVILSVRGDEATVASNARWTDSTRPNPVSSSWKM
jgi:NADH-quinone oxidoreductase subunit M